MFQDRKTEKKRKNKHLRIFLRFYVIFLYQIKMQYYYKILIEKKFLHFLVVRPYDNYFYVENQSKN